MLLAVVVAAWSLLFTWFSGITRVVKFARIRVTEAMVNIRVHQGATFLVKGHFLCPVFNAAKIKKLHRLVLNESRWHLPKRVWLKRYRSCSFWCDGSFGTIHVCVLERWWNVTPVAQWYWVLLHRDATTTCDFGTWFHVLLGYKSCGGKGHGRLFLELLLFLLIGFVDIIGFGHKSLVLIRFHDKAAYHSLDQHHYEKIIRGFLVVEWFIYQKRSGARLILVFLLSRCAGPFGHILLL